MPATAQNFDEGVAAYDRGDYETAMQEFRPLAEQGHADAQAYLGLMYAEGHGISQDYAQALKWFHLAAEQGGAKGQNDLGAMYFHGLAAR